MTEYGTYQRIHGDRYEAKIQLDPYNSRRGFRISGEPDEMIESMQQICREHDFGKMICAVHPGDHLAFLKTALCWREKSTAFLREKPPVSSRTFSIRSARAAPSFQKRMKSYRTAPSMNNRAVRWKNGATQNRPKKRR